MADKKHIDETTGTQTVGHEWDGIEELDTPMPRWWLMAFYACILWGVVYVILYPAWPLVNSATEGVLGWTSRGEFAQKMAEMEEQRAPITSAIAATPVEDLLSDERLTQAAIQGGSAAFKVHCVQCHGSGAAGSKGYPNLNDDDWLWGGDIGAIHYTIEHGIRNPDHDATRLSQMPAFGEILSGDEINLLVNHVRSLSGKETTSARGRELFANNCAACHGENGKGSREFGAPNLTDKIWLFGGGADDIRTTITKSRYGVMPRWNNRLDPATIKMLAIYVHSRGGGEARVADELTGDEGEMVPANVQP